MIVQIVSDRRAGETEGQCRDRKTCELTTKGSTPLAAETLAKLACLKPEEAVEIICKKFDVDEHYAACIAERSGLEFGSQKGQLRIKGFDDGGITVSSSERNIVVGRISTEKVVDRDGEILVAKGVDFTNYRKNPVVLWMHRRDAMPIGRNMWPIKVADNGKSLIAKTQIFDGGIGAQIMDYLSEGFPLAISVGLIPKKIEAPTPQDIRRNPRWAGADRIVWEWELAEYSFVTVPANPDATIGLVQKGLLSEDITDFLGGKPLTANQPTPTIVRVVQRVELLQ